MAEFLTFDGTPVPVLIGTWRENAPKPGSRARTERGQLRSVRLGDRYSIFTGRTFFATRDEAEEIRDMMDEYGDHEIEGEGPGRTVTVESDVGEVEAEDHRPNTGPTAQWGFAFTFFETGPETGGETESS